VFGSKKDQGDEETRIGAADSETWARQEHGQAFDCGSLAHRANAPGTGTVQRIVNSQRPLAAQIQLAVGTRCAQRTKYAET